MFIVDGNWRGKLKSVLLYVSSARESDLLKLRGTGIYFINCNKGKAIHLDSLGNSLVQKGQWEIHSWLDIILWHIDTLFITSKIERKLFTSWCPGKNQMDYWILSMERCISMMLLLLNHGTLAHPPNRQVLIQDPEGSWSKIWRKHNKIREEKKEAARRIRVGAESTAHRLPGRWVSKGATYYCYHHHLQHLPLPTMHGGLAVCQGLKCSPSPLIN